MRRSTRLAIIEADHLHEQQLSGVEFDDPPGVVSVRMANGAVLELRNDTPKTRGDCPTARPCGHIKCRAHTWNVAAADRAGRRLPLMKDGVRKPPGFTIEPRWLEEDPPPSCALDVAARFPEGARLRYVAEVLRKTPRALQLKMVRAIGKLKAAGVNVEDMETLAAISSKG